MIGKFTRNTQNIQLSNFCGLRSGYGHLTRLRRFWLVAKKVGTRRGLKSGKDACQVLLKLSCHLGT